MPTPRLALLTLLLALLPVAGRADEGRPGTFAIVGARVEAVSRGVIENGAVLVADGRIALVCDRGELDLKDGIPVVDATGMVLVPGLVDTHSHCGVYSRPGVSANADGNEATAPVQSIVRAIDSIFPVDPGFRQARAGGITTANVMPGSANVIGGQTAYVKTRGRTVDAMRIDLGDGPGGLKMANGENPKRTYGGRGQAPATRMKVMALQREAFLKAQEYAAKWRAWREKGEEGDPPKRDLALDPLVEVLERRRTVHFHSHRADDILSALRLADEFGFELVLHHATEAHLVADEIASRGVACSLTVVDSPGGKPEAVNLRYDSAAKLHAAGVRLSLNTDDPVTESRFLLRTAALLVRGGLPRDVALRAVTLEAARQLHLDHRLGSIEAGKDADFVLLDGDPFATTTRVRRVWIEGEPVFDLDDPADARFAAGGYHVRDRIPGDAPRGDRPAWPAPARLAGVPETLPDRFVVEAGVLHTATGDPLRDAWVLVDAGRIAQVGSGAPPPGLPVAYAPHVTPGLIDAHGSAGLSGALNVPADQDLEERTAPVQASLRALDGFHARADLLRYLLAHGVTLIHAVPGPHPVLAGQSGVFRTDADTTADATVRFPAMMVVNLGESPKAERDKAPTTRMGTVAILRKALAEAQAGRPAGGDDAEKSDVDLDRRALEPALEGDLPVLFVAHREDDLLTALRVAGEFGLRVVLGQATEGYLVADELAAAQVPVIAAPTMQRAGGLERFNTCLENPARLAAAGVPVAISSGYEGYVPKTRVVLFEAAMAWAWGMDHGQALRAVTIDAARILGVEADHGSLEAGKVADLALFDGDPLEHTARVVATIGRGRLAFRRAVP